MKINWPNICTLVSESILNKQEKSNVLEQLDVNIGRYALNYKLPMFHSLTENEYIEFARIVKLINEENKLPQVTNEAEYKIVVSEIFDYFGGNKNELPKHVIDTMTTMDAAFSNNDFAKVNEILSQIEGMM